MASQLHLRPDRLRTHAATAATLAAELRAAAARPGPADPAAERLRSAVARTAAELAALSGALAAAASVQQVDRTAARAMARGPLGPGAL